METMTAKKLEAIDLMRLYGSVGYLWDLQNDTIQWRGPFNKLLCPEIPLNSGSSFNNILTAENLWHRLNNLVQASPINPHFNLQYHMTLPRYTQCPVEEKGIVIFNAAQQPMALEGTLKFLHESHPIAPYNLSGYDSLTGFSEKQILLETLTSHLEQSQQSGIPSAYLAITIDRLTQSTCLYGIKFAGQLIKEAAKGIRQAIRFNDFMSRTSGCCFGIILRECDRWGIIRASDRLINAAQKIKITLDDGQVYSPSFSMGGLVFPGELLEATQVINRAEKYLFEAQSIKGFNVAGMPYHTQIAPEMTRPIDQEQGNRRTRDLSKNTSESLAAAF